MPQPHRKGNNTRRNTAHRQVSKSRDAFSGNSGNSDNHRSRTRTLHTSHASRPQNQSQSTRPRNTHHTCPHTTKHINTNTVAWQTDISVNSKGTGYVAVPENILKELRRTLSTREQKEAFVSRSRDNECEAEIQPHRLKSASHNDTVKIALAKPLLDNSRIQVEVVEVLARYRNTLVATTTGPRTAVADDKRVGNLFKLDADAPAASKVLLKITSWERNEATVLRVIGKVGQNNAEMLSVALDKGFSDEHPPEAVAEAERQAAAVRHAIPDDELARRRDFRQTLTFTIDPADAKDFDDAISIKPLPGPHKNRYEIGVHIADVSYFVREGTALDREALKRATSVYLVDRTIPMLPSVLSDDVCSLVPHKDRLTFSAVFEMDTEGHVHKRWLGRTVIHSAHRFTYETAQEGIVSGKGPHADELRTLNVIAKKLAEERIRRGSIDFDKDEVKFELDANGKPIRVMRKQRLDAHRLVEDFMLLANRAVAEFFSEAAKKNMGGGGGTKSKGQGNTAPAHSATTPKSGFIYRIHTTPDKERIIDLSIYARALGYDLESHNGEVTSQGVRRFLDQVTGTPHEHIIKTAAIRSMAKAIYSTQNIGHFGLAFSHYTHFTSPIRRYPDLLVHRALAKTLAGQQIAPSEYVRYQKMAEHSTEQEIMAAEAERASIKYKQVEFMQEHVGSPRIFEGTITGVTDWGVYVEENESKCEGMIKIRDLGGVLNDYFALDEKNYRLVGERSKRTLSLGETVKFRVTGADLERRTLDYSWVEK